MMLASPAPIPSQHQDPHEYSKVQESVTPIPDAYQEPSKPDTVETEPQPASVEEELTPEVVAPSPPAPAPPPFQELVSVERLSISKRLRVRTALFLRGKKNRFLVRGADMNTLYTVAEENTWWVGYLCYGLRPLQLKVTNSAGEEVMRIDRPYACTSRIFPCQLQSMRVYAPPGNILGTIEQKWTVLKPLYVVKNNAEEVVFWIFGPFITISCFSDVTFTIARADGSLVGSSRKRWQGLAHALFFAPITDKFGVAFDVDLSVSEKALLLAATLLLQYMYYDA